MTKETDFSAEILDVRDLIERFEYLEAHGCEQEELDELMQLKLTLEELKGNGGDEEWRGDWYPITLVSDSYFIAYTQELLEDCGYIPKDFPSWIAVDWEKTAEAVQTDYTYVSVDGWVFWYR